MFQIFKGIDLVIEVFSAKMHRNICAESPSITGTSTIINFDNNISFLYQPSMKHCLSIIIAPSAVNILKITCPVNKHNDRILFCGIKVLQFIDHHRNHDPIARLEMNNIRCYPANRTKFFRDICGKKKFPVNIQLGIHECWYRDTNKLGWEIEIRITGNNKLS